MLWTLLNSLLFLGAGSAVAYLVLFAAAARWGAGPNRSPRPSSWPRLVVYVPAYEEDAVIVDTARRAAEHDYPGAFEVVVIADSLRPDTMAALDELPTTVVPIDVEESTKGTALNRGLDATPSDKYDAAVVLDADNVMAPGFLRQVARSVADGTRVVQGRRVAKNHDTALARLDGASEAINNQIFRRGHRALGLSAALIGSGMALEMDLFRRFMGAIDTPDGFDKELELRLLRAGTRIEYAPDAVVYDEKVRADAVFVDQRRRWIGAQARYLRQHFAEGLRALVQGGPLDYVDKVAQMLLPPRALLLAILPALAVANAAVGSIGWAGAWVGGTVLLAAGLVAAVPADRDDLSVASLLSALPRGVWLGLRALLRSREGLAPNTTTPHHTSQASAPSS